MFCCTLFYVHYSIAIILMGKRELVALLNLSSWCLVVERLFLAVSWGLSAVCDCGISWSYSLTTFGLQSLLRYGLSKPELYGDLVYKLKKVVDSNNFQREIAHYHKIVYNINVWQQNACLVVNPNTVGNFAFLFNCTPMGRTSYSMTVLLMRW